MKLLWIFRAIFLVVLVAVVFVNISSPVMDKDEVGETSKETYGANLRAIIYSSIGNGNIIGGFVIGSAMRVIPDFKSDGFNS